MNETVISWNITNWITVALMAFTGFAALTLATTTAKQFMATRVKSDA